MDYNGWIKIRVPGSKQFSISRRWKENSPWMISFLSSVRESMLQAEFRMPDRQLICWSQRMPLRHCSKAKISMRKMLKDEISTWISPSTPFVSFRKIHFSPKKITVLSSEWNKGVIESLLLDWTEKYYRPTIILTESNGLATGSARSSRISISITPSNPAVICLRSLWTHVCLGLTPKAGKISKIFWTFLKKSLRLQLMKNHSQEIEIDSVLKLSEISSSFLMCWNNLLLSDPEIWIRFSVPKMFATQVCPE